ncbi:hypothetical protein AKJ41_05695 [candidate division MSBL1 archaeon SCGC-AAA259O05]|uniref:Uncharacterized protein n=1 Tax=candidate division MSBL1 archaeon SCGC-AAA259O05 TaxID=1698271 RepID=A0A133UYM3_9EURY|nr:hypothetical protein AKJ41_05695 [candidate division MSBL1 archaeon SCGC-AAA259O05]
MSYGDNIRRDLERDSEPLKEIQHIGSDYREKRRHLDPRRNERVTRRAGESEATRIRNRELRAGPAWNRCGETVPDPEDLRCAAPSRGAGGRQRNIFPFGSVRRRLRPSNRQS